MPTRSFYQYHECAGYSAKVTIEWTMPDGLDDELTETRMWDASDPADAALAASAPKLHEIVQTMRRR